MSNWYVFMLLMPNIELAFNKYLWNLKKKTTQWMNVWLTYIPWYLFVYHSNYCSHLSWNSLFYFTKKYSISFFLRFFFSLLASSFPFLKCTWSPNFSLHLSSLSFPSSLGFLKDLIQCYHVSSHVVSILPLFWELRQ